MTELTTDLYTWGFFFAMIGLIATTILVAETGYRLAKKIFKK